MAVTLFAAINVGSYEVEMKIFQYVTRKGIQGDRSCQIPD